jgi:hypothetical protein
VAGESGKHESKVQFVEILIQGTTPTKPATKSNLDSWVSVLAVPFTSVIDIEPSLALEGLYGPKETTYVIERATRKIVLKTATPAVALGKLAALP